MISDVIILIAALFQFFSSIFFVTIQSMTVPIFPSKPFSYEDLRMRQHYVSFAQGMIIQIYPEADRVKQVSKHYYQDVKINIFCIS